MRGCDSLTMGASTNVIFSFRSCALHWSITVRVMDIS